MMIFEVNDMTCGHCVKAITQAVNDVDPKATVQCDLASHRVSVQSGRDGSTIETALVEAGYSPVRVD